MKLFLAKYKWIAAGLLIGAIGGWSYWHFVGCASGSCMITSRPLNSSLYGAFMGAILFSMFDSNNKPNDKK